MAKLFSVRSVSRWQIKIIKLAMVQFFNPVVGVGRFDVAKFWVELWNG